MIVLDDQLVDYPKSVCWRDAPTQCPRTTDYSPRRTWIRAVVLHTVDGRLGPVKPGGPDTGRDLAYARYQAHTPRLVSWDYTIDLDGSIAASNDPARYYTWHATDVNPVTIGVELVQDGEGALYVDQLAAAVAFVGFLCDRFGIQKQVPVRGGAPLATVLPRLQAPRAGRNFVGVYGHRNQTPNRGPGDPGSAVFLALLAAGFEGLDFGADQDLDVWRQRQRALGLPDDQVDGVPGPMTLARLKAAGYRDGLWVNGRA